MRLLRILLAVALAAIAAFAIAAGFIAVAVGAIVGAVLARFFPRLRRSSSAAPSRGSGRPSAGSEVIDVTAQEVPPDRPRSPAEIPASSSSGQDSR